MIGIIEFMNIKIIKIFLFCCVMFFIKSKELSISEQCTTLPQGNLALVNLEQSTINHVNSIAQQFGKQHDKKILQKFRKSEIGKTLSEPYIFILEYTPAIKNKAARIIVRVNADPNLFDQTFIKGVVNNKFPTLQHAMDEILSFIETYNEGIACYEFPAIDIGSCTKKAYLIKVKGDNDKYFIVGSGPAFCAETARELVA